jgi:DNA-binding IclR family transcriptional regulator
VIVITNADIIRALRRADRALLLREVAPDKTQAGMARTLEILRQLEERRLVSMNPQTDRWRYIGPEIRL